VPCCNKANLFESPSVRPFPLYKEGMSEGTRRFVYAQLQIRDCHLVAVCHASSTSFAFCNGGKGGQFDGKGIISISSRSTAGINPDLINIFFHRVIPPATAHRCANQRVVAEFSALYRTSLVYNETETPSMYIAGFCRPFFATTHIVPCGI